MSDYLYGSTPLGPRVVNAKPGDDYRLYLTFTNGEKRVFDASSLLQYPAFQRFKDKAFFDTVFVAFGTVCWPGDIDYCPDTLYAQSVLQ